MAVMDQMQRKIQKFEEQERLSQQKRDNYNDLLIKYNTMVYKMNTNDQSTISKSENTSQPNYNALRVKSASDHSRSRSNQNRSITPNSDLNVKPNFSDPGSFMVKQEHRSIDQALFVEDNCSSKNPNFLRDPKLTQLEDENRFLKEELKRQVAKTKFFRTKFNQLKQANLKLKPV